MSVPIRLLTLVIKKSALTERYPGGPAGFRQTHPGVPEDEHLFAVPAMSWDDLQIVIDTLDALGIDTTRNCAVGDWFVGPLDPCEGIEFRALEAVGSTFSEWEARIA
jgi:hypothetical protein